MSIFIEELQRSGKVPMALNGGWVQTAILFACILLGLAACYFTLGERSGQFGDIYHDVIVAPAFLFLAIVLVPVFWLNARWYEWLALIVAAFVWAGLVFYDFSQERMNQRQWLVRHGFSIKGEIPKR